FDLIFTNPAIIFLCQFSISIPPLTLPKLPLPPIPFPMDLPLLPPVVMQSMALQTQPWLDSNLNPELAKLYQSQLNKAILGPQPHLSTALLAHQPSHPSPIPQGKRTRTRISEEQVSILRKHFDINSLPKEEYDRLSALLSLPNRVIVVWFQNARQRARKNQDRGPDDGFEVKNNLNNTPRHKTFFCTEMCSPNTTKTVL
uniref:Homeobox domain-containing protein n=1 Tax=Oryzias latipes TaxID=8090 RepID=A0A3P9JGQ1_ORYLA